MPQHTPAKVRAQKARQKAKKTQTAHKTPAKKKTANPRGTRKR